MELTRTERWILSNQLEILKFVNPEQLEYFESTQKIINNGYEFLYEDCIRYIYPYDQTISKEESKMVIDFLDMFRGITRSLDALEDNEGLNLGRLKFYGFDGNHESKYFSFAQFYCEEFDGGRFQEIGQGDDHFNSHSPFLDTYHRMYEVWNTCQNKFELTKEELIQISDAFVHPDNR